MDQIAEYQLQRMIEASLRRHRNTVIDTSRNGKQSCTSPTDAMIENATRILLIEDEEPFGSVASAMLVDAAAIEETARQCKWAVSVMQVKTLEAGIAMAGGFDAILLDLKFPGRTPEQTLETIEPISDTLPPIIILTNADGWDLRAQAIQWAGADDFIWKGEFTCNPVDAFARIMHAIFRRNRRQVHAS